MILLLWRMRASRNAQYRLQVFRARRDAGSRYPFEGPTVVSEKESWKGRGRCGAQQFPSVAPPLTDTGQNFTRS